MVGDVIVKFDGQPLDDIHQLLGALAGDVVGGACVSTLVRGGALTTVEVLVGERPRRRP